ncbi:restriction endonuclease [Saccharothrix yanglingensis]|uniref:restriction endonuclease n=1 Tax=Saccharothrix yanglingensis TaxID=659496 RepID=UPI0027D2E675|nr:restriction endonuclease [Saccharothrix yanglingensis]
MVQDEQVVGRYPNPGITPGEFEQFVAGQLLGAAESQVEGLVVSLHEKIAGVDGTYDFDATVRYRFAGMDFLVVVEAKAHRNPIKRELVQVLRQKVQSVGAHKGVLVATSAFQAGAVEFARTHGIALVTAAEGRFVFTTRDTAGAARPALVACYHGGAGVRGMVLAADDEDYPECVAEFLLGRPRV